MTTIASEVKAAGRRMTLLGVITIILGLASIAAPLVAGLSLVVTVGSLVMGAGILRMIWAFGAGSLGKGVLAFLIGCLTLLCGLAMVFNPIFTFGYLTVLIAIYLLADGMAELVGAFRMDYGRVWMMLGGVASILLGIMMWRQYPLAGGWAIGTFLGIKLLFIGLAMRTAGSGVRSIARSVRAAA
jgi:uncharacterized membrane protein HdeD (DUF308 family)